MVGFDQVLSPLSLFLSSNPVPTLLQIFSELLTKGEQLNVQTRQSRSKEGHREALREAREQEKLEFKVQGKQQSSCSRPPGLRHPEKVQQSSRRWWRPPVANIKQILPGDSQPDGHRLGPMFSPFIPNRLIFDGYAILAGEKTSQKTLLVELLGLSKIWLLVYGWIEDCPRCRFHNQLIYVCSSFLSHLWLFF